MLKTILKHIVVCVLPIVGTIQAQNNCDDLLRKAKDAHSKGHYADAFAKYRAVKLCNPALSSEMEKQIDKLFAEVDAQRVRAEQAEKKATEEKNAATAARQKAEVAEIAANEAKEKTERILESLYFFDDKFGVAVRNQKYGFIDRDGNEVIRCKYLHVTNFNSFGFAEVMLDGRLYRMIDTLGNEYSYAKSLEDLSITTELLDLSAQKFPNGTLSIPNHIIQANNLKIIILNNCDLVSLPAFIGQLTNLKYLYASGNNFKHLPNEVCNLKNLRILELATGNLQTLPDSIGNLTDLRVLDIHDNRFSDLPKSISKLQLSQFLAGSPYWKSIPNQFLASSTNLQKLKLTGESLTTLPNDLFEPFPNINSVSISNTKSTQLPNFSHLKKLQNLDFSNNKLQEFSINLSSFPLLQNLIIDYASELKSFAITGVNNLSEISLVNAPLKKFPIEINKLPNIQRLNLSGTQISAISLTAPAVFAIRELDFSDMDSLRIIEGVNECKKLTGLTLGSSPLVFECLPIVANLPKLEFVAAYNCGLFSIPLGLENLPMLKRLDLSNNNISEAPHKLSLLSNLLEIDLSSNPIKQFIGIKSNTLEKLSLDACQLHTFSVQSADFPNLKILHLTNNKLTNISLLPEKLHELDLSENPLVSLPNNLKNLSNLFYLGLSQTNLRSLPADFGNLRELKTLFLDANPQLESLPTSFGNLKKLQDLRLENSVGLFKNSFPAELTQLSSLENLSLIQCSISSLPESFANLQNLNSLDLGENSTLSALPASFKQLKNLKTLHLNDCPAVFKKSSSLSDIVELHALEDLYLSNCDITLLPSNWGDLSNLNMLALSGNTQLAALPASFVKLQKLDFLDAVGCKTLFKNGFPLELTQLSALTSLNLSDCNIPAIPNEISHLTKLENLSLDGSPSLVPQAKAIKKLLPKMCDLSID